MERDFGQMKIISCGTRNYQNELKLLYSRPACPPEIEKNVAGIVAEVREKGDSAIRGFMKKFDGVDIAPSKFMVTEKEFKDAAKKIDAASKKAIRFALANIQRFAEQCKPTNWTFDPRPGVILGEQFTPMERVGCYIPGGTAPLVSTVIHTVGIAAAAGVREIVAVTPPMKDGSINPATLYALKEAGATEVYRMGGAYAIAAMAYGTDTLKKVDKIVGPGNAYVAAAKKLVYGNVSIDMVAGPSEIMIVADAKANPAFIAADMLSQAEHGSGLEQAVLVTNSMKIIEAVKKELASQSAALSRDKAVKKVLENGVFMILCKDMTEALQIAGEYAPEHLELMFAGAEKRTGEVRAAGAIFIGHWTPEPAGDFTAGPSHVLPTAGTARFFHGLTVSDFMRRSSILRYEKQALAEEIDDIVQFAEMEGLDAHGKSASVRKKVRK